jgi:hypothetical protein
MATTTRRYYRSGTSPRKKLQLTTALIREIAEQRQRLMQQLTYEQKLRYTTADLAQMICARIKELRYSPSGHQQVLQLLNAHAKQVQQQWYK